MKVEKERMPWEATLTSMFGITQAKILDLLKAEDLKPVKSVQQAADEVFSRRGVHSPYVTGFTLRA